MVVITGFPDLPQSHFFSSNELMLLFTSAEDPIEDLLWRADGDLRLYIYMRAGQRFPQTNISSPLLVTAHHHCHSR